MLVIKMLTSSLNVIKGRNVKRAKLVRARFDGSGNTLVAYTMVFRFLQITSATDEF